MTRVDLLIGGILAALVLLVLQNMHQRKLSGAGSGCSGCSRCRKCNVKPGEICDKIEVL